MYIVLLGAPGSGKGTQAKIVAAELNLLHLSTGDEFRAAIQEATPLGRQVKQYLDRGELVPDSLTVGLVREALERKGVGKRGVILDGFPRTVEQARELDKALAERVQRVDAVIYLQVPDVVLITRLDLRWTCGNCGAVYGSGSNPPARPGTCDNCGGQLTRRSDDRPEVVRERLEEYFRKTLPVVDYYRDRDLLVEIDGDQPVPAVTRTLVDALGDRFRVSA